MYQMYGKISLRLTNTKDMDYNKLVSIALADKDLIEMSKQMNDNLESLYKSLEEQCVIQDNEKEFRSVHGRDSFFIAS